MKIAFSTTLISGIILFSNFSYACEAGESNYLCFAECVQIEEDSPNAAEVMVCASSEQEALVTSQAMLLTERHCALNAYDGSGQSTLETLRCGECGTAEWCHDTGGLINNLPTNDSHSLGGFINQAFIQTESLLDDVNCWLNHGEHPETIVCVDGVDCQTQCMWTCEGKMVGVLNGVPGFYDASAWIEQPCDPIFEAQAEFQAALLWNDSYPQLVTVTSLTTCEPMNILERSCDSYEAQPEDPKMCRWMCEGYTYPISPIITEVWNIGSWPRRLPYEPINVIDDVFTEVWGPCYNQWPNNAYADEYVTWVAEQLWRYTLDSEGAPWNLLDINPSATMCFEWND